MCAAFDQPEKAAPPAREGAGVDASCPTLSGAPLIPGHRWQAYQIGDRVEVESGWCFKAINAGMLEDVLVWVEPLSPQSLFRARAWAELKSLNHSGLIAGLEAYEENGYRYEVVPPPPPATLREWGAARQAGLEDVRTLMRQLGGVVAALHDRGVVHLNLSPDTIYVRTAEAGLHVVVGGLERATAYNQPELVPVPVHPYYAPPEAAGLQAHSPGAGLRAWDWWSLGRVMQELVLGRHVLELIVNRNVAGATPELRMRAEALLMERDPNGPRAGAVERMPAMDAALGDLLRGLLTSSRDGRWGADEVQRWLAGEPVKDRYQLGKNERLFPWKDRMFTVAEAAEYFTREENWADGIRNLFAVDDVSSFVYFTGDRPDQQFVRKQIDALHDFVNVPAWAGHPSEVRRSAAAAAAWARLAGEGARLVFFGRRLDAACLRWLLGRENAAENVALVQAMTAPAFIELVGEIDPDAARSLAALATIHEEAFELAATPGWIDAANPAQHAQLMLLALEPPAKLAELCGVLRGKMACTRDPALQEIFGKASPSSGEKVLLAFTAMQPEQFRYVSHADWNTERLAALRVEGERLARGLFWLRRERALRSDPFVFGRWPVVVGIWVLLAATLTLFEGARGFAWALVVAVGVAALRAAATVGGGKFTWQGALRDSRARILGSPVDWCRREAQAALGGDGMPDAKNVAARLFALNAEIGALKIVPRPAPVRQGHRAWLPWCGTVAGWLTLAAGLWVGVRHHWSAEAASALEADDRGASEDVIRHDPLATAEIAGAESLTRQEFFFSDPQRPLLMWNVPKPRSAPELALLRRRPASAEQIAAALVEGHRRLRPYAQRSVDALIAVPVFDEAQAGLMIYDGRTRTLFDRIVVVPEQLPESNTWISVADELVFYLGEPFVEPRARPSFDDAKAADLPEREIRSDRLLPDLPDLPL